MLRTKLLFGAFLGAALLTVQGASAKVGPQEAARLGSDLTPLGAERAGNKDGSIPPWTGGFTTPMPGYERGDRIPDFWADEKPLLTIDSRNMNRYRNRLSAGAIHMLTHVKNFRMLVYQTHRTAAAPQWVYDNTFANATRAESINNGNNVVGAYGGIPFPIPQNGKQVVWNSNLAWRTSTLLEINDAYIVAGGGKPVLSGRYKGTRQFPYYDPEGSLETYKKYYNFSRHDYVDPPNRSGESYLAWAPSNDEVAPYAAWIYLTGQRRVRKAPNIQYDGAFPDCSGSVTVDELNGFNGNTDRYDARIIGKKEIYIPYNNNGLYQVPAAKALLPHAVNPELVRWELHRVWVVEMTVAKGKRHIIPRRVLYFDEDTWKPAIVDEYDDQGRLWKWNTSYAFVDPNSPVVSFMENVIYDLQAGQYCALLSSFYGDNKNPWLLRDKMPDSFFQPTTLAAEAQR